MFRQINDNGSRRVVLYGVSDLAEIAMLRAVEYGMTVVAVCDPESEPGRFIGALIRLRPPRHTAGSRRSSAWRTS